jgi:NAD(P)-dependent dehydrogenase (short-subunit alcohol dehydrogenase family)
MTMHALPLEGKTAVVTGGAKGIGRAIAEALHQRGARVAITSRQVETAHQAVLEIGTDVLGCACDVRDPQSITRLMETFRERHDGLDILVNNAGIAGPSAPVDSLSIDEWNDIIATNLTGSFLVTRAALPLLRPGGMVVFTLSIAARTAFAGMSAYVASKHGLLGFANTLREELRPRQIRVVSLLPGATDTEIWQQFWPDAPRQKMISPETVAEAALAAILMPEEAAINEIVIEPTTGEL